MTGPTLPPTAMRKKYITFSQRMGREDNGKQRGIHACSRGAGRENQVFCMKRPTLQIAITLLCLAALAPAASALEPDEILLLVNKNIPESRLLAQFYANARRIPEGRILALPLPI